MQAFAALLMPTKKIRGETNGSNTIKSDDIANMLTSSQIMTSEAQGMNNSHLRRAVFK